MDLLPLRTLAPRLGIAETTLRAYSRQEGFPEPVDTRGRAAIFDADAVTAWVSARQGRAEDARREALAHGDTLVTLQEAAEHLGLSYGSMRTYLGRFETFPKPVERIGNRPYFSLSQIQRWNTKRLRGTAEDTDAGGVVEGLIDRAGVAELLGVKPASVTKYATRSTEFSQDFPQPARTIGRSRFWDPQAIKDWRDSRPRTHHD